MVYSKFVLACGQVLQRLRHLGRASGPSLTQVVGGFAIDNGSHLTKVIVGIAVGLHQQLCHCGAAHRPSRRIGQCPPTASVGSVCHFGKTSHGISLKRSILHIGLRNVFLIGSHGSHQREQCHQA